jgi:hypothetical protein
MPEGVTVDTSGNEIAKVRDVGEGIGAELRIRPMWSIPHPAKMFSQYVDNYEQKLDDGNPLFLTIPEQKFEQASPRMQAKVRAVCELHEAGDSLIIEA